MRRLLSIATLYPNPQLPRFGTFVARSLEALAAREDWAVTVINPIGLPPVTFGHYRALARAVVSGNENGVVVHRLRFPLIPRIGGRFNPALIARSVLPRAHRLHAAQPFDVVDAQFFYPDGPAAARIAAALGLPLSIKARGADISYWGARPYARAAMCDAADRADILLAVSEALRDDMAQLGLQREKIAIHYTGLDRALFHPRNRTEARAEIASRFGIATGGPLLATVGALIPRKGQALVIAAMQDIADAKLALVGNGPDRPALQAQAKRLGLAGRVHFLGSLDHQAIATLLAAADAMVLPSASEGLANAWVEALACGTPLVITDVGGARELVHSASAGLLVGRNAPAIAAGICALLAAPPAQDAVAATVARFSWSENAADLARYYRTIAAG